MIDEVRRMIRAEMSRRTFFAFGNVRAVDWARQLVRVALTVTGYESNWLRIAAGAAGDSGGSAAPLRGGDEVLCCFPNGDPEGQGVVLCRLYGSAALPSALPENAVGYATSRHKVLLDSGGAVICQVASIEASASGKLEASAASIEATATGTVEIDGLQVKLGGGASAGVKFEELSAVLTAWTPQLQIALAAAQPPVVAVVPPIVIAPAMATKVRLT